MRVGRRGRFVGLEMTRFHQPLRAVARFACIAALLCCCGFVPREKHAGQTQANELEGVYVVGTLYKRGHNVVVVWENGVPKQLTDKKGYALAEAVSDADVYVAGLVYGDTTMATLWKNGVPQSLPDGEDGSVDAIAVSDGTVYVTGTAFRDGTGTSAMLWCNGMPTDLGNEWYPDGINVDGANVHNECFPDGISVDGADVYITGWFLKYDYDKGADGHAVLWKAGEFRELSLLPGISYFLGPVMIVSDGHVYAAGQMDWRTAMVWKDGKTIPLSRPAGLTRYVPQFFDIFVK